MSRYHLIGIGGAGMAPVAELLAARGLTVSGSDARASAALERLLGEGPSVNTVLLRVDPKARPVVERRLNEMPKVAVISARPRSASSSSRRRVRSSMFQIQRPESTRPAQMK